MVTLMIAASPSQSEPKVPNRLLPLVLGLAIVALVLVSPAVLNDGDTWWHVRAGQWMISQRAVLHHDI